MNHMKETPEFWEQVFSHLSQYKEQGAGALIAAVVATIRGLYNGGGWKKTLLDALICAFFGWSAKSVLTLIGLNPEFAYLCSVVIGFMGVDMLSKIIKGKAGVNND
ncbi:TPA: phage holin, lambda family [Providencia alcalifaciens]|nr:phage holin, lambda family [Providencia alcalifaciens]